MRGQPAHATYYLGVRGSSPLVRGQLSETAAEQEGNWIIPARAGPTSPTWCPKARSTDHPRSCGANIFSYMKGCDMDGSSPLVRGQLSPSSLSNHSFRIIPARAGPTTSQLEHSVYSPDHPRSCGANLVISTVFSGLYGSSPLVRGQHNRMRWSFNDIRIIPARAGPTPIIVFPRAQLADHPRSCGANCLRREMAAIRYGSSPLVRGQPCPKAKRTHAARIIPARAGPTP